MIRIEQQTLIDILDFPSLINAVRDGFTSSIEVPTRHHHTIGVEDSPDATLLLMPAWKSGDVLGVKLVTVYPSNAVHGLPAVMATYLLFDARTGAPLATIEGKTLTERRTAAASALASEYLSRRDSRTMLMVGAGSMAGPLIEAHTSVREIEKILIWNIYPGEARTLARRMKKKGYPVEFITDIESGAKSADIISCATLSTKPLILGDWLSPGTHLDLVGAFTPEMRETDDHAISRSDVFVDTRDGALSEAGDLIQAINSGSWSANAIMADLAELAAGVRPGRTDSDQVTVFKSVGTAIEDLAAAKLAYDRIAGDHFK